MANLQNLTNTGSKNPFKLCPCAANLKYTDLSPFNEKNGNTVTKVFLRKMVEMFLDHIKKTFDRNEKVIDFHQPEDLESLMDIQIPQKPLPLQQLLNDCHQTLQLHAKNAHPRFFSQQCNGMDLVCLAADWFTSLCNVSMVTYEVSTVFILMEKLVFDHMREIIGWQSGESMVTPGGSLANLVAIVIARNKKYPDTKEKGMENLKLAVFTSKAGHYSVKKACVIIGIGAENCIEVDVGPDDRMNVEDLQKKIDEVKAAGKVPFFISLAFGTSALGAYDDLMAIKDIARANDMWIHIDGALGASMLMSKKIRKCTHLFDGIEEADSVSWSPQKLMNLHLTCSTIHFKEEGLLESCFAMKAKYLFMEEKAYDTKYDIGDQNMQCSRRNDIFKLWLMWRSRGDEGFEKSIDRLVELTKYLHRRIQDMCDKFHPIHDPAMVICAFWYIPKRLRDQPHSKEKEDQMAEVTMPIKNKLMTGGSVMIAFMKDDQRPNYFRVAISSNAVTEKDLDFLLCEIDRVGQDM